MEVHREHHKLCVIVVPGTSDIPPAPTIPVTRNLLVEISFTWYVKEFLNECEGFEIRL